MNYFENMLQSYRQFDVKKPISVSKKASEEFSKEEPSIVIFEYTMPGTIISTNEEFQELIERISSVKSNSSNVQYPEFVLSTDDKDLIDKIGNALLESDYEKRLEALCDATKEDNMKLGLK